ncbi:MAG: hypothetical protein IKV40_05455 [Clostridia bacterium]|nr:hypothetical protein [Clostridia bacterium]
MKNKKHLVVVGAAVIVALVCVVAVQAYLFTKKSVQNDIIPAKVSCLVEEAFKTDSNGVENQNIKETVTVKNTGDFDSYIRIIAVTYWEDTKGNLVERASKSLDLASNLGKDWIVGADNIFYYKYPVAKGASTTDLLKDDFTLTLTQDYKEVTSANNKKEIFYYNQVIEFIAEAIQAEPDTAVTDSWGVTSDKDGLITGLK